MSTHAAAEWQSHPADDVTHEKAPLKLIRANSNAIPLRFVSGWTGVPPVLSASCERWMRATCNWADRIAALYRPRWPWRQVANNNCCLNDHTCRTAELADSRYWCIIQSTAEILSWPQADESPLEGTHYESRWKRVSDSHTRWHNFEITFVSKTNAD